MNKKMKLKPCSCCGRSKTDEDIHGGDREWFPTFYDPDSGGEPLYIRCECGLEFSAATWEYDEFVEAWNASQ